MSDDAFGDDMRDPGHVPEVERAPVDPWLERRRHGFGGSDMGALFVALGRWSPDSVPGYVNDNARVIRKNGRVGPRIFLEKAGFAPPLKPSPSMLIGKAREPELLAAWCETLGDSLLDADSVIHYPCPALPVEMLPQRDMYQPRLAITPDASCRNVFGGFVAVECKCSRYYESELPRYWRYQCLAQIAVMGATEGVVVLGRGWSISMTHMGDVDAWHVERDEKAIAEIREAVADGWARVDEIKTMGETKGRAA